MNKTATYIVTTTTETLMSPNNIPNMSPVSKNSTELAFWCVQNYRFTTYQDGRRVRLVDGLEYLKQIFYEYHPLSAKAFRHTHSLPRELPFLLKPN